MKSGYILAATLLPLWPLTAQTIPATSGEGMTLVQFQERARTRIMARDADGNGRVSQAESSMGEKRPGNGVKGFARMDGNGDGQVDRAEIDAILAKRFARLDADKSGIVTRDEQRARRQANSAAGE